MNDTKILKVLILKFNITDKIDEKWRMLKK